ncbi:unnamed protein product [Amoebophrya sp. A25]|nr:unnamed protein product [Amoebophrya sp. A25]|eukprot:GSA25T00018171001.1
MRRFTSSACLKHAFILWSAVVLADDHLPERPVGVPVVFPLKHQSDGHGASGDSYYGVSGAGSSSSRRSKHHGGADPLGGVGQPIARDPHSFQRGNEHYEHAHTASWKQTHDVAQPVGIAEILPASPTAHRTSVVNRWEDVRLGQRKASQEQGSSTSFSEAGAESKTSTVTTLERNRGSSGSLSQPATESLSQASTQASFPEATGVPKFYGVSSGVSSGSAAPEPPRRPPPTADDDDGLTVAKEAGDQDNAVSKEAVSSKDSAGGDSATVSSKETALPAYVAKQVAATVAAAGEAQGSSVQNNKEGAAEATSTAATIAATAAASDNAASSVSPDDSSSSKKEGAASSTPDDTKVATQAAVASSTPDVVGAPAAVAKLSSSTLTTASASVATPAAVATKQTASNASSAETTTGAISESESAGNKVVSSAAPAGESEGVVGGTLSSKAQGDHKQDTKSIATNEAVSAAQGDHKQDTKWIEAVSTASSVAASTSVVTASPTSAVANTGSGERPSGNAEDDTKKKTSSVSQSTTETTEKSADPPSSKAASSRSSSGSSSEDSGPPAAVKKSFSAVEEQSLNKFASSTTSSASDDSAAGPGGAPSTPLSGPSPPIGLFPISPSTCADDPIFKDGLGFKCKEWTMEWCRNPSPSYSEKHISLVHRHCKKKCGFCHSKVCEDDASFRDMRGYTCAQWSTHDCKAVSLPGYSRFDMRQVRRHCRRTCKLCEDPSMCQDSETFTDETGKRCEAAVASLGGQCVVESATEDLQERLSQVRTACPRSCNQCATTSTLAPAQPASSASLAVEASGPGISLGEYPSSHTKKRSRTSSGTSEDGGSTSGTTTNLLGSGDSPDKTIYKSQSEASTSGSGKSSSLVSTSEDRRSSASKTLAGVLSPIATAAQADPLAEDAPFARIEKLASGTSQDVIIARVANDRPGAGKVRCCLSRRKLRLSFVSSDDGTGFCEHVGQGRTHSTLQFTRTYKQDKLVTDMTYTLTCLHLAQASFTSAVGAYGTVVFEGSGESESTPATGSPVVSSSPSAITSLTSSSEDLEAGVRSGTTSTKNNFYDKRIQDQQKGSGKPNFEVGRGSSSLGWLFLVVLGVFLYAACYRGNLGRYVFHRMGLADSDDELEMRRFQDIRGKYEPPNIFGVSTSRFD